MKYLLLSQSDRQTLLEQLEHMPDYLEETFRGLSKVEECSPLSEDSFSPVEHCWHLADLEREGYETRIHRLLEGSNPRLEDFDGARIAFERQYKKRSLAKGIAAFRQARQRNLSLLLALSSDDWNLKGEQDGVGPVMLCDIPVMMQEHDSTHREEIATWLEKRKA